MRRSILIKIHLYCGLFTIFYLIAFGFSSLVLNHKIELEASNVSHSWETVVQFEEIEQNDILAQSIRDQLDLMGWTPFWLQDRDSASYKFTITHPGRNYRINLNLATGLVQVNEMPKGFLAVLNGLHFFNGNVPNAPLLLRSWAIYQWLALFTMLVSLFVGLWLWLKFNYKPWEGVVFGGFFVFTLILMLLI